jgi:hypothetical protein
VRSRCTPRISVIDVRVNTTAKPVG